MSRMTGKKGKITIGGVEIAVMTSWTVNGTLDVVDVTAFQDTWHQKVSTFKSWAGSCVGHWTGDAAFWTAFTGATAVTLVLYIDSAATTCWTGTAFCNFSITTPFGGAVDFTASFEGTDALTFTA